MVNNYFYYINSVGVESASNKPLCALNNVIPLQWRPLVLPDRYIDHGSPADQLDEAGLTPSHIAATVFNIIGQKREALEMMS